ncbi:MAG: aminoacyl-tRNA hydrolase [Opitutae bacterium]
MKLILLGLGNPGNKYQDTRHNLGHWFTDRFSSVGNASFIKSEDFCLSSFTYTNAEIILLKSSHYMNANGTGLASFLNKNLMDQDIFMVVHDEVGLPLGKIKISQSKSAGGHNGVRNVIDALGYCPLRLRLGIDSERPPDMKLSDFVLSKFSIEEQKSLDSLFPKLKHAIGLLISRGISFASNYTNRYPIPSPSF